MSYDVQPWTGLPLERILALVRLSLGEGRVPRGEAFWRWKHEENPFGQSPGLAAMAGGQLAGLRVCLRWRWAGGGRVVKAARAVDTATHPAWRRRGIFRRLTEEVLAELAAEGLAFVFNTPNAASRAGYLSMGWKVVGRVRVLVRPLRPGRLAGRVVGRAGEGGGEFARHVPSAADLLEEPALPAFLDALWASEGRLHTPRTTDYLRWRYARPPGLDYRALWELRGNRGAVVIARGRCRRGLREVAVTEVLLSDDPEAAATGTRLLRRLLAGGRMDYAAANAAPGTPEQLALTRAGFLPFALPGPRLAVRPLALPADVPDPRRWASWRTSLGDLELF